MPQIKTVLFDLDGTLVDTAPDMSAALDKLCREEDQQLLPYDHVREYVSDGSVALVKLAFGDDLEPERLDYLKNRYLEIYQQNLCIHSTLFKHMAELLSQLEEKSIKWGVVTNKPGWLTEPLLEQLALHHRASCIVSGDTTENRKPHPEPMLHACEISGSKASECMYVGDAQRDIEAGTNAEMKTLVATYGYIKQQDDIDSWGASAHIDDPMDVLNHL